MKKLSRALVTGISVVAMGVGTAGIASADTASTPVWLLPGVDLGALLGPTTAVPGALAPVFDLLRLIGG